MNDKAIGSKLTQVMRRGMVWVESRLKQWTRPAKRTQVMGIVSDLKRSQSECIAENLFLRQQLIVLRRQVGRAKLTQHDRHVLVLLASRIQGWREALVVVKSGFRLYWRRKSRAKIGRPPTSPEVIALIEEMAVNNRTWYVKRLQGEQRKLGIKVSRGVVRKYMRRARMGQPFRNHGQTWATVIKNHAGETWACDCLQAYDLFFRAVFVYFIIELGSRRIVQYGVTRSPSDFWVAQQLREATP